MVAAEHGCSWRRRSGEWLDWRSVFIMKLYLCHKDDKIEMDSRAPGSAKSPIKHPIFIRNVCHGGAPRERRREGFIEHSIQRLIQLHELLWWRVYRSQLFASAPAGPGTRLRMCAAVGSSKLSSRSSRVNDDSPLVLSPPPFSPLPPDALRSCPCSDSGCTT